MKQLYEIVSINNEVVVRGEIECIADYLGLSKYTLSRYVDDERLIRNEYKLRKVKFIGKRELISELKINKEAFETICEYTDVSGRIDVLDSDILKYTCNRIRKKVKKKDKRKFISLDDVQKYFETYEDVAIA